MCYIILICTFSFAIVIENVLLPDGEEAFPPKETLLCLSCYFEQHPFPWFIKHCTLESQSWNWCHDRFQKEDRISFVEKVFIKIAFVLYKI